MHLLKLHRFRYNCFHGAEDANVGMEMSLKNVELEYGNLDQSSQAAKPRWNSGCVPNVL